MKAGHKSNIILDSLPFDVKLKQMMEVSSKEKFSSLYTNIGIVGQRQYWVFLNGIRDGFAWVINRCMFDTKEDAMIMCDSIDEILKNWPSSQAVDCKPI
jgi:hypothetical protein